MYFCICFTITSVIQCRGRFREEIKQTWPYALAAGVLNGSVNLLIMVLNGKMPASLMFPLIAEGSLIILFAVSVFRYKEVVTTKQKLGFCAGLIAVALLNI